MLQVINFVLWRNEYDSTKNHGALKEDSEDGEVTWGKEKITYKDICNSFHPSWREGDQKNEASQGNSFV